MAKFGILKRLKDLKLKEYERKIKESYDKLNDNKLKKPQAESHQILAWEITHKANIWPIHERIPKIALLVDQAESRSVWSKRRLLDSKIPRRHSILLIRVIFSISFCKFESWILLIIN